MRWSHVDKEESTHWLIFALASAFVIHFASSSLFSFVLLLNPLIPNIKFQILLPFPHTFLIAVVGRIC